MDKSLVEKAEGLARQTYTVDVERDETTDGQPVYVARVRELEGCISQGKTDKEAKENVKRAMVDYIYSLLEDGLPIPPFTTSTTSSLVASITIHLNALADKSNEFASHESHPIYRQIYP
jgi:predicted RNase H-like HicB family nuclease